MNYNLLIEKAKEKGFSDIEIAVGSSSVTSISVFSGGVDKTHTHDEVSITVRGIYNGKMAYYSTSKADEDLDLILDTLKENALSLTTQEEFEIFPGSEEYPEEETRDGGFLKISLADKVNMLLDLEKEVRAYDERIILVPYCEYQEVIESRKIINSKGLDLEKKEFGYVYVQAVGKKTSRRSLLLKSKSKPIMRTSIRF